MKPSTLSPQAQGKRRPWKAPSWRNFPLKAFLCLLGALVSISSSFALLAYANDSPIDDWPVAPTIILSIMVTLSNAMMRAAFSHGADIFWWSSMVPNSGTTLRELHSTWYLAHNSLSTLTNFKSFQPIIRLSNMLVIAIAINGPLLQRSIRVELETWMTFEKNTLNIRREPLWNFTAKLQGYNGHVYTVVPYQDEFAEAVLELNQRDPMTLSSAACPADAACMSEVTVAGFTHQCSDSEAPTAALKSLRPASAIIFIAPTDDSPGVHICNTTGAPPDKTEGEISSMCEALTTYFQLEFKNPPPDDGPSSTHLKGASSAEPPWKAPDLPPAIANYISYTRNDSSADTVLVRSCEFSTSFIRLRIRVTNSTVVTILQAEPSVGLISTNGIESIPRPLNSSGINYMFNGGFVQALSDLYSGYILYNSVDPGHLIQGSGPRQFINQSSIKLRKNAKDEETPFPSEGYQFSCFDPLSTFVSSLNELSLRYALKSIPNEDERSAELESMIQYFAKSEDYAEYDLRTKALPLLKTKISQAQVVDMSVIRPIPVYKVSYRFTAIAVGLSVFSSFFIALLLRGWRTLGRKVSFSPLELAKAFDAPLLANAWSNSEGDELARDFGETRVRYENAPNDTTRRERVSHDVSLLTGGAMDDDYVLSELDSLSGGDERSQRMVIHGLD